MLHWTKTKLTSRNGFKTLLISLLAMAWLLWLNNVWPVFPGLVRYRTTQISDGYTELHSAPAKFGPVPSLKGFTAPIVYIEGNGCNVDPKKLAQYNMKASLVLVHEGKCHYDELVTIYEMFGARGVIVASGQPVDVAPMKAESHLNVKIPSIRVGRVVADKLKTQDTGFIYGEPDPRSAIVEPIVDTLILAAIWSMFYCFYSVSDTGRILIE